MSKADLLKVLNRLDRDIPIYKEKGQKKKLDKAIKDRDSARRWFYECGDCADKRRCTKEVCQYHDEFVRMANETEDKIANALKRLLRE